MNPRAPSSVIPGRKFSSQTQMLRVHAIRGDQARTALTLAELLRDCPAQERQAVPAEVSRGLPRGHER